MGSQKKLHLEKERPACLLTASLSCWTQLLPSQPSTRLSFPSFCHVSSFNPFHMQLSSPLPMCMARACPIHTRLQTSFLQSHYLHLTKESFFLPFSHSCLPCKVLQLQFTPGLLCAKRVPFHIPPPAHTYQLANVTPHQIGCRHLLTVLVTVFMYLSSLTFHPGNKNVTLPFNKFIIINFHSQVQNNLEF